MRLLRPLSLTAALLVAALSAAHGQDEPVSPSSSAPETPTRVPGFDPAALDRSADACQDFYQFACGGWLEANPLPPEEPSYGRFKELADRNRETLREILEAAARPSSGRSPLTAKIGDYYASCMDEAGIERKGLAPLEPTLARIDSLSSKADLAPLLVDLHLAGVGALFGITSEGDFNDATQVIAWLAQGGLGLPDRDYYFKDDEKSAEHRSAYLAHVARMMQLAGRSAADAAAGADTVMRIETELARHSLDVVALRDPQNMNHKTPVGGLATLTPRFDWPVYLRGVGLSTIEHANLVSPRFFEGLDQVLASTSVEDLKTYLRWQALHAAAPLLPEAFVDEDFAFFGRTLMGQKALRPRWKRCVDYTDEDLGEALGQAYVERRFGQESKARTLAMVHQLERALAADIETLPWMTAATRQQALTKLKAIANKIGYPDTWRDYGPYTVVRGDALGNSARGNAFELRRQLAKAGKPVQRGEWLMTPPTVNAYYHPLLNEINFPAGILQPPFFDNALDDAVNYGAIGAVIGHELTHGFDDQGRQFAADGDLRDWWTEQDAREFEARAGCFVDQYGEYEVTGGVKVNGKLTLGENVADNGGVRIAYMALMETLAGKTVEPIDGFTPGQRFFLGWAQIWCENASPEFQRLKALTNPHAENRYRVNGVVVNMPEFAKAFGCAADAPMVRDQVCRIW